MPFDATAVLDFDDYKPLGTLTVYVIALVVATAIFSAVTIGVDVDRIGVLNDILAGRPDVDAANRSDELNAWAGVLSGVVFLAAAFVWVIWFRRAYRNLPPLGAWPLRFRRGWAVWGWCVPILGLWRPKQLMNDIWRGADPDIGREALEGWTRWPVSALVNWWWGLYIAASLVSNLANRRSLTTGGPTELRTAAILDLIGSVLIVAASVPAVMMLRAVNSRQDATLRLRGSIPAPARLEDLPPASTPPATPTGGS